MTKNQFYQKALLQIASNSAFGNGRHSYVDYGYWSKKIHEAAEALTYIASRNSNFDDEHKEPGNPP